jgi:acetoin utilization deacetylase AcuC-like enzyme
MKIFYTDQFGIQLPKGHSFPIEKYALLRRRIMEADLVAAQDLRVPHAASDEEILRAHDRVYLQRLINGELTDKEVRRIGLPWSPQLLERARRSAGATVEACFAALTDGVALSLSGGTHHAFRDRGEGYCLLNDSVIAARAIQAADASKNILIVDCDVHQGNGTASITRNDPTVFTFSIHGRNNFPRCKEQGDLDVALDDGTDDQTYLKALQTGLKQAFERAKAHLTIYLAGADPYRDDRFGRLALTKAGLKERDRLVFGYCEAAGLPVAATMAGGYSRNVADTVDIHFATAAAALEHGSRILRPA